MALVVVVGTVVAFVIVFLPLGLKDLGVGQKRPPEPLAVVNLRSQEKNQLNFAQLNLPVFFTNITGKNQYFLELGNESDCIYRICFKN